MFERDEYEEENKQKNLSADYADYADFKNKSEARKILILKRKSEIQQKLVLLIARWVGFVYNHVDILR